MALVSPLVQPSGSQFVVQFWSVGITVLWTGIASYVILKLIDLFTDLRVDQQDEIEGLDLSQHGNAGIILLI